MRKEKLTKKVVQSLPVSIKLTGFGINRMVFMDEANVLPEGQQLESPFMWGCGGEKAAALATAILVKAGMSAELSRELALTFVVGVIQPIKDNNFCMQVKLREFFERLRTGDQRPYEGTVMMLPVPKMEEIEPRTMNTITNADLKPMRAEVKGTKVFDLNAEKEMSDDQS